MYIPLEILTPIRRSGNRSFTDLTKRNTSSGIMIPAVSQTVSTDAPCATAVSSAWIKNAGSLLPASSAQNSTSSHSSLHLATLDAIKSSICSGFLRYRYSIWTVETGSDTWSRGAFASFRHPQVYSIPSGSPAGTGTVSWACLTAEHRDLISSPSVRRFSIASVSMESIPSLSRSLHSSSFSRKERVKSFPREGRFIVMSLR